jgi:hypothetical protein
MSVLHLLLATTTLTHGQNQLPTINLTGTPAVTLSEPFIAPAGFNEMPGNRAVLIDRKDMRLTLVDFARNTVQNLSRLGAGPREYRRIDVAFPMPGGATLVPDAANNRAVVVAPDGGIALADYSRQAIGVAGTAQITGVDQAGMVYVFGVSPGQGGQDSLPIIRWAPTTRRTDTLAWWPMVKVTIGPERKMPDGGTVRALSSQMFAARTIWRVLPSGGVAIVHPAPYRVEIVDTRGRHHLGPVVTRDPIRIDAAERDAVRKDRGGPIPDNAFPATYPPFEGTNDEFVTPEGTIWVERYHRIGDSTSVYDVFDQDGRLSAQATLRPNSKVIGFGKNSVYIVRQTTDDDFWHLEQWRRPSP